ncbi:MAG: alpha/beta fold hydrolase [Proteobacteria bacterium]|nr:alpha/beta fold hydrolase [Pseudomonadota bacterium]
MSLKFFINLKRTTKTEPDRFTAKKDGLSLKGTNGAVVILIHGLTGTPHEMRFIAKFLNKKGYSVLCPRLANHGEPIHILKNTRWQDCYQSVKDVFIATRRTHSGPIFAGGLSMGALLALLLTAEFKDSIAGICCLSPTLFYDGWNVPWYRCFLPLFYLPPLKHILYFKEEPPYGIKNEALRRRVHKYYSNACLIDEEGADKNGYPYFPVSLLHQLQLLVKYLKTMLPSITIPVQLIQAQEDDMTSINNSSFIYHRIASRIKEMVLLHDSYHMITADQERATVAQKMDEFFTRVTNNPAPDMK